MMSDISFKDNVDLDAMREHLSKKIAATPLLLPEEQQQRRAALLESRRKLEGYAGDLNKLIADIDTQLWDLSEKPKMEGNVGKCFIARRWNVPPSSKDDYYDEYFKVLSYDTSGAMYEVEQFGNSKNAKVIIHSRICVPVTEFTGLTEVPQVEYDAQKAEQLKPLYAVSVKNI